MLEEGTASRLRAPGAPAFRATSSAFGSFAHFDGKLTRTLSRHLNGVAVPEKFDLTALPNNTVTVLVSENGPQTYSQNDSFNSVLTQISHAAQTDKVVKGLRSFGNLAEGKISCIFEGPNREAVAAFFKSKNMPTDSIVQMDFEGECGNIVKV